MLCTSQMMYLKGLGRKAWGMVGEKPSLLINRVQPRPAEELLKLPQRHGPQGGARCWLRGWVKGYLQDSLGRDSLPNWG